MWQGAFLSENISYDCMTCFLFQAVLPALMDESTTKTPAATRTAQYTPIASTTPHDKATGAIRIENQ